MRFAKSMRMLLRSPVKSLVTFILIGAVTFGFSSHIFEYAVATREMARLAEHFKITGTLESSPLPPHEKGFMDALMTQVYDKLKYVKSLAEMNMLDPAGVQEYMRQYGAVPPEAMAAIQTYPHVVATSSRYMGAGISDTYYRMDANEYLYQYSNWFVAQGVVTSTNIVPFTDRADIFSIAFKEFSLLAGNPAWAPWEAANANMLIAFKEPYTSNFSDGRRRILQMAFGTDRRHYAQSIQEGDKLLFLGKAVDPKTKHNLLIGSIFDYWCEELVFITNEPEDYLQTEAFAPFRLAFEMANADNHTFDMV